MINFIDYIRNRLLGQVSDSVYSCQLHFFVDGTCVNVECTAEDIWETDYVVDLVWIVRTACWHQDVRAACHCVLVADFRHRVGKCEYDRVVVHRAQHILREYVTLAQAYENISTLDSLFQSMNVATVCGKDLLLFSEVFAVACNHTLGVEHQDIFHLSTESYIELGTTDGSSTGTIDNDFHLGDVLTCNLKRIFQTCCRDDGSTMLVVMHHRDVESLLQTLFDVEALRSLDVLQVDTTERWSNALYNFTEFFWVFFVNLDIKDIDSTINLEE